MPLPSDATLVRLGEQLLEQFDKIFGLHPGFRPAHAKGMLVRGTFTPAPDAASLSRAPHFNRPTTPVTARFSNSTGLPKLPDGDPNADPRGMAVRFHLAERTHTDIVAHAANGFPARNGQEFLDMLKAIAASDPTKLPDPAHPSPIEAYLATHPAAMAFVKLPKPAPTSFARERFFAVSAYRFVDAAGQSRHVRYRLEPDAGTEHLDDQASKKQPPDYLADELRQRLADGPVGFKLRAQVAEPGDAVDDATVQWPADRSIVELGSLTLTEAVTDDAAEQQHVIFDPIPRVDGIEPSDDPLLELRAAVYLMSGRRRRAATPG